ncbi:MAG TPA: PilZ domain-containing protein [Candidatus Acidoferrales bacterium]|nr:PilZ domain-containing protein [Candidatus Acidoferrales bacterium]
MKTLDNSGLPDAEGIPVVTATPIGSSETTRAKVVPVRTVTSTGDAAAINFLRQFRVLLGAARLYQRNHPRLMETLASVEQQLRIALTSQSPLVFAVEQNGMILPRYDGNADELLRDPRGELRGLAEELLRGGICSMMFVPPINVGELDSLAHEISQVPRSAAPGDTASRKLWDTWSKQQRIAGIRLNIPTERHDSLLLASMVSAVLAYDDSAQLSTHERSRKGQPPASFEQVAATLRVLSKLVPPRDPEMRPSAQDVARRIHSVVSSSERHSISLIVHGVTHVKPREGETLEPYLERLADTLTVEFLKQEFDAGRVTPPGLSPLLVRLDQERNEAAVSASARFGGAQYNEVRVAVLCDKFWNTLPVRVKGRILRSHDAWCAPPAVVARYLEPLATAADTRKVDAAGREGRGVLLAYARCLSSEENKARRAVAAGLAEISPQIQRLWPHSSAGEFGKGIVHALLVESSPGIAGLLSAVVENLARISLIKHDYAGFESILETLESSPRDDEHAHIATLVARLLSDDQWLYLIDEALANRQLNPVIPRLLQRCPDRLIDRLGLLLTAPDGLNSLPAMVRLVHRTGEPVLGALESRLYEPRRQRIATAIHLLASADPKRLASALPRALVSWEWNLQDLAVTELMKWTHPSVVAASAQAFLTTIAEAHSMVVPCMIDHLGFANEITAVPVLLQIAAGEHLVLREIYVRIKATEALGRMHVTEAAPMLRQMVRERSGLTHAEPAALRMVADEALALLENRSSSARPRASESARSKLNVAHSRARRYLRAHLRTPLPAAIIGARSGVVRVRSLALGGAFLETEQCLIVGDSLQVEIRSGLRRIQSTAMVRNVAINGAGIEFVHLKAGDRERLRRLVAQLLK